MRTHQPSVSVIEERRRGAAYRSAIRKRHEDFLRQFGYRKVDRRASANIGSRLLDWARGSDSAQSGCDAVFNSGKKTGKALGSLRFGHVDL